MPHNRARIGYTILYTILVVIGLAILLRLIRAEPIAGILLLAIGSAGLFREARRVLLAAQAEQTHKRQQAARAALEEARRERATRQRQERLERRQTDTKARARQTETLRAEREQALATRRRRDEERASRQEQMEARAARWLALYQSDQSELAAEIEALFARRGFSPERAANLQDRDACYDLLLTEPSGRHTVVRCLDHYAHATDIQNLDVWRRDAERSHAYLIALEGFSPQAVRFARNLPITLVEAHLLATWEEQTNSQMNTD